MQQAHGEVVRLSERVQRIVAPNPGPMTGHGTNTYLIGSEAMAVLDPGPAIDSHIEAILDAVGDRLRWIVCTHTHPDHSPAAAVLAERTGAKLVGRTTEDDQHQDLTFQPDWLVEHDEVVASEGWHLRAIWTPGHVDNHVCYLLEEEGMVFARRPHYEWVDRGDYPTRWQHEALHRVATEVAGLSCRQYRARARGVDS
jgi:glyoxylase-like metal-dependent hydrolase (beta-lactamase superfamily II)